LLTEERHFQRLMRLLDLEAKAEEQEILSEHKNQSPAETEASGNSLITLVIRSEDAGMGGRILLTLGKRNQNLSLPWTRLVVGSPVILSEEGNKNSSDGKIAGWRGVISNLQKDTIQVALKNWTEPESDHLTFRLIRSNDEISRQRQREAMEIAQSAHDNTRLAVLRDILLGKIPAEFHRIENLQAIDSSLNEYQRLTVNFAMSAEDLAIVHGPPGTGKTTTVVELIRQIVRRGQKVLACAPSNLAVDNILERLIASGENAIRLGHPARVLPELREHTLDVMVENHPDVRFAQKLRREARTLREKASKYTRARPEDGAKQAMRDEAKQIMAEAQKIEDLVVQRLLDNAPIICSTLTGLDRDLLGNRTFDWCVIDEASQCTEPVTWIPLLRCERLVLAGDPFQLPPTVISPDAAADGFNISLLERILTQYGSDISRRLTVQYRMHQDIMAFPSREFYENSLVASPDVQGHLLKDLPNILPQEITQSSVLFIDTAGASYDEIIESDGKSRLNPMEAELTIKKVHELLDAGLPATDIAVIAPYAAQVRLLQKHLKQSGLEIDTVDGFQGREKEAVVVSLVRSNQDGEIGFLGDVRRMNVALTRAKRKLIVIGDSATVTVHPFYARMVEYFDKIGAYHSVWEEF
jgi:ATP-dependent RNA/DNA helicase IGHMBP2